MTPSRIMLTALAVALAVLASEARPVRLAFRPALHGEKGKEDTRVTQESGKPTAGRHALLVGVTKYPGLAGHLWLEGGANDVVLWKDLLTKKYKFPAPNIVTLSEAEGEKNKDRLPTKKNIERECKALAKKAAKGDQVMVLLSGHGSRQPEPKDAKDPQPDGFDKIFLPRDVRDWDHATGAVPNAITGREVAGWLRPAARNKALLWVVVDACHSGQMLRGNHEKAREVNSSKELKIPAKANQEAEKRASQRSGAKEKARGKAETVAFPTPLAREDGVVMTYACLSKQVTVEGRYKHPETGEEKPFGLLSHTINGVLLASSEPLTYRELMLRVQKEYTNQERDWPTPVIEGTLQANAVLGQAKIERPTFAVSRKGKALTVNAGALHGLTRGTILAVYPPFGAKGGDKVKGHVEIRKLSPVRSEVAPVEHGGMKAPAEKDVIDGRCAVAELNYDDTKLKVALDRDGSRAAAGDKKGEGLKKELAALEAELKAVAKGKGSPFAVVASPTEADWLVRLYGGKAYILRAAEAVAEVGKEERKLFGPPPAKEKRADWLKSRFGRIVRAEAMKKLAGARLSGTARGAGAFMAQVKVEINRPGEKEWAGGVAAGVKTFYQGDEVQFRVTNPGKTAVDVTVLYVNSKYGIVPLFPAKGAGDTTRLAAGQGPIDLPIVDVDADTAGREHVVVIAVKAGDDPMDFTALAQPDIESPDPKERKLMPRAVRGQGSPLGRLFQAAHDQDGKKARMTPRQIENYVMDLVEVRIIAGRRPGGGK